MNRSIVFTILCCVCAALPLAAQTASPEGMVQISAGKFWMGRSQAYRDDSEDGVPRGWMDDRPATLIYLDAFSVDKYEVTNADYAKFLEATGGKAPWHWPQGKIPKGDERLPVSNVNWFEATAFCKSVGKRLPTEAEWEKAARGGLDRQTYSWGDADNATDDGYAPSQNQQTAAVGRNKPAAVGSFPPNGYGLYDMIGNVMEWTNDWFEARYYNFIEKNNPRGPETGLYRSVRGGGWAEGRGRKLANFYRNFNDPELRFDTLGFRCVK